MLEALGIAALVLGAVSVVFLAGLVARRTALARGEQHRTEAELRLRPFALALLDGEAVELPSLTPREQAVLAESIGRLSRSVTGDARGHIAEYYSGSAALAIELRGLRDRRSWRRATAAFRLGDMACIEATPALLRALGDPDRDVRSSAARSLGRLEAPEAAEPLVQALVGGTVARPISFRAMLDIGHPALPGLRRMARFDDPELRAAAVELIGWIGEASDAELLTHAVGDPAAEVRARSAAALGRLGAGEGAEALTRALDDRIYFVRLQAARALGQVGEREAVPALLRQARGDRFEAARAAAEAIARIDPEALLLAAEDTDAGPHLHEAADLLRV